MTWPDTDEESEWQRRDEIHSNLQKPHPVHPLPSVPSVPSIPNIPFHLTPLTPFAILQAQRQLSHSTCDVMSGCRDVEPMTPSTSASTASTASTASCRSLRSDRQSEAKSEVGDRPPVGIEAKPFTRAKAGRKTREMLPDRNDLQPRGLSLSSFSSLRKDGASNGSNGSNESNRSPRDLKGALGALPVGRVVRGA